MDYTKKKLELDRLRRHVIFPKKIKKIMPKFYETEGQGYDAIAYLKVFDPTGHWYWYATEFDGIELFFGLVLGDFVELGYFSLPELELGVGLFDIPFERDLSFEPTPLREIVAQHQKREGSEFRYYPSIR